MGKHELGSCGTEPGAQSKVRSRPELGRKKVFEEGVDTFFGVLRGASTLAVSSTEKRWNQRFVTRLQLPRNGILGMWPGIPTLHLQVQLGEGRVSVPTAGASRLLSLLACLDSAFLFLFNDYVFEVLADLS